MEITLFKGEVISRSILPLRHGDEIVEIMSRDDCTAVADACPEANVDVLVTWVDGKVISVELL